MKLIGKRPSWLQSIYQALEESPLTALRQMLTNQIILHACQQVGHSFRRRTYGPVVTVFHFLAAAIQREYSFAATWQELWTKTLADLGDDPPPFNSSGLSQARSRLPRAVLENLFDQFRGCPPDSPSTWRGFRLLALDASTVSMPNEPKLAKHFGLHKARKTLTRYPLATVCTLLSVGTSAIIDYRFGPFDPGELKSAGPLLDQLGRGDMLLADRRYSGTPTLAYLYKRGCDFLMRKNGRLIVKNLPVVKRLGKDNFITDIPMSKPARKLDPTLPETVRVRIFRARVTLPTGKRLTDWFVTSLLDAALYPSYRLAILYHCRWRIETSYLEFKQWFGADILRSKTVDNIYKEFLGRILAYQLIRRLICQAAHKHHKPPTQISFLHAARWTLKFSTLMSAQPAVRLPDTYQALLDAIASTPIIDRPGRIEPRAIVREKKHFTKLKIPRAQWRETYLRETAKCLS